MRHIGLETWVIGSETVFLYGKELKSNNGTIDSDDKAYCRESDSHNGPVVEYSEVTSVDRLGDDRILRLKRDYYTGQVPDQDAERAPASSFDEIGFQFSVMNRQEALDHTVDLTEGEREEKVISDTDTQTVDGDTVGTLKRVTDG